LARSGGLGIDAPLSVMERRAFGWFDGYRAARQLARHLRGRQVHQPRQPAGRVQRGWPGYNADAWHAQRAPSQPSNWFGSLIADQRDASGLLYRRNRVYDPAAGRFTQEDPIGIAGGLNTYGFGGGDPVNYTDPFGLCVPDANTKDTKSKTTCEKFADKVDQIARSAKSTDAFVRTLGKVFAGFPTGHFTLNYLPVDRNLRRELGPGTGFRPELNDNDGHVWRHFSAYVVFGYEKGALEGAVAAEMWELPFFSGHSRQDVLLGALGAQVGDALKHNFLQPGDVAQWIREHL
jgi:RHS repeat-associated protein